MWQDVRGDMVGNQCDHHADQFAREDPIVKYLEMCCRRAMARKYVVACNREEKKPRGITKRKHGKIKVWRFCG